MLQLLQAPPAACEQVFPKAYIRSVEVLLGERPFDHDGLKSGIDDKLRVDGIAADVPLRGR